MGPGVDVPDIRFWSRRPYTSQWGGVVSLGQGEEDVVESSKITLTERARRETILNQEHVYRIHLVKQTIYALHLSRTNALAFSNKSFLVRGLVQADTLGSFAHGVYAVELCGMDEEKERVLLEEYEYDARVHLVEKVWPGLQRVAKSLFTARQRVLELEQEGRFRVWQDEQTGYNEIAFKRSTLRHMESVMTQLQREDTRISSISTKLNKLGHRSLVAVEQHPPTPPTPPAPISTAQLKADCEFISTHLEGLRTLRSIEEDKIHDAHETLSRLNEEITHRQRVLSQY